MSSDPAHAAPPKDPPSVSPDPETTGGSGWDLYGIARAADPHARWRALREATPVLDAGDSVFFVSSWALVDRVLRDPELHAGAGVAASFGDAGGLAADAMRVWLMSLDGEEQTRARGLVRRAFTPRAIGRLEPRIREASDALVAEIVGAADGAEVDLVEALAFALPSEVIRSLFGIPRDAWRDEIEAPIRALDDAPGASLQMIEAIATAFDRRLTRGDVPEGLLAELRTPDPELGRLSHLEVVANAVLLVTAAIDTTAGLIGNTIHCLLERPDQLSALRTQPDRLAGIVEETLRFEPPALSCSRSAPSDTWVGEVRVPAGSQLLLGIAAANRDPDRYPEPDVFDPTRDHTGLLSFGGGRHVCLGAALARLEARLALEALLLRAPIELERVAPPRWQTKNPTVRALDALPVRVSPRASSHGGAGR